MLFLLKFHGKKPGLFGKELQQGSGNISLNEKETYYLIPFLRGGGEGRREVLLIFSCSYMGVFCLCL